jgi:hypothetical protein
MGVGGQRHAPAALPPPPDRPGTHCVGGWVGPRAGLDGCGKSRPPPGFDPRTVQPVASRYTDYPVPTHRHKGQYQTIFNGYRPNSLWDGNRSSMGDIPVAGVCVSFTDSSGSKSKEWCSVSLLAFTISFWFLHLILYEANPTSSSFRFKHEQCIVFNIVEYEFRITFIV